MEDCFTFFYDSAFANDQALIARFTSDGQYSIFCMLYDLYEMGSVYFWKGYIMKLVKQQ